MVAVQADAVLHDPDDRVDGLDADQRIGRRPELEPVEHRGEPLVRGDRDVVALRAARQPRRQMHGADEGIEFAERATRRVFEGTRGLVGGDVRITTHEHEPSLGVEHRERQVATDAVCVVDVEHRGERLGPTIDTADRLDPFVVDVEGIPVDVAGRVEPAGQRDRVEVGLQDVADVLRGRFGLVRLGRFPRLASEGRSLRQPLHVHADQRIADVGVTDRRARLVVGLSQPNPQVVAAAGGARGQLDARLGWVGVVPQPGLVVGPGLRG